jgi:hypothetical protein
MNLPRTELVEALLDAFTTIGEFDRMLEERLNVRRILIIAGTGGESATDIVAKVVAAYDSKNNGLNLIRAALASKQTNPKLLQFVATYPEWNPAKLAVPLDPFATVIMRGYRVFLRRHQYRKALQAIGNHNNSRVLAIDGGRCSGKTYSRDFLNYLVEIYPPWAGNQLVMVDLDKATYDSVSLAKAIGAQLPLDDDPLGGNKHEQAARRLPDLISWIGKGIKKPNVNVWWIVLDGFRLQVHPDETHDLIRSMMDMADNQWGNRIRLILLNYSQFLDEDVKQVIIQESIDPVERKDVDEFFRCVYAQAGQDPDEADLAATVDDVMAQVDEETKRRGGGECTYLRVLSIGLTKAARKLLAMV